MDKIFFDFMNDVKATRNNYRKGKSPLQDLHDIFGFDFNKPIVCGKKSGAFTPCALAKEFGVDFYTHVVVVVMKEQFYYNIVRLYSDKVEIDYYGTNWFNSFYSKKEYNERRQNPWFGDTYVIAQRKDLVSKVRRTYDELRNKENINERYIKLNGYNLGKKGYGKFHISSHTTLDKSGYPFEVKRDLMEKSKRELIKKRSNEQYKAMVNTQDMINKARSAIEAKKVEMAKKMLQIKDRETAGNFKSDLYYLCECYSDLESIEEKDARKGFESPHDFNCSISYIYAKLARI